MAFKKRKIVIPIFFFFFFFFFFTPLLLLVAAAADVDQRKATEGKMHIGGKKKHWAISDADVRAGYITSLLDKEIK